MEKIIKDEVKLYDDFLTGNVYAFRIIDSEGETVDSCGGFYGDINESGIVSEAQVALESILRQSLLRSAAT